MANWSAIRKGATGGAIAGLAVSKLYMSTHAPLGFYTGSVVAVFAIWIGFGTAVGAGIAHWASSPME